MRERPIPFSAPMVRALLAGTKRQTRRIAKGVVAVHEHTGEPLAALDSAGARVLCPYGQPGDRLWVREAWKAHITFDHLPPRDIPQSHVWYMADDGYKAESRFRQGMFMPRWASRILLEVTEVRVERLHDISAEDAQAEGITFTDYGRQCGHTGSGWTEVGGCDAPAETHPQRAGWGVEPTSHMQCMHSAPTAFAALWSQINGVDSWAANPWVWAVSFKPVPSPAEAGGTALASNNT